MGNFISKKYNKKIISKKIKNYNLLYPENKSHRFIKRI